MCPYEEKVTAWLLGDLSTAEQEAVTRHLAACETCRSVRDELATVVTPLRGGLAKDQRLRLPTPAPSSRHWGAAFFRTPWVRAAALFLMSCGAFCLLISLYYQQVTARKEPLGPITTITFHKGEPPPEPLEPIAMSAGDESALPLSFDAHVPLVQTASVAAPDIPAHDIYLPHFLTFAQFAMWGGGSNTPLAVYNQLVAQQIMSVTATNATDGIPILQPTPPINAQPPLR